MLLISRGSMMAGLAAGSAVGLIVRASAQAPSGPFKLEPLPYPSNKNKPHIDTQTMEIHHGRHHAAYVNNLNTAAAQYPELGSCNVRFWPLADIPSCTGLSGRPTSRRHRDGAFGRSRATRNNCEYGLRGAVLSGCCQTRLPRETYQLTR
jgi:hypothetical protein